MTTLATSFSQDSPSTAIIVPSKPDPLTVSYEQLSVHLFFFQQKLSSLGITPSSAVSIALPNSFEFVVAFLATTWQRAIAAPLNPAYKQDEFEFYIDDLSSALALVPQGAVAENAPAVRAARKYGAAVAECYWNGKDVVFDVKHEGKLRGTEAKQVELAREEDVALVLHTSGTTGRPKAVPLTHRNLTRSMHNIASTYALAPTDRTLLVMPLFHVHGLLASLLAPLHAHSSLILPPRFSARDFWSDFAAHGATWYSAVPTIHQILLSSPHPAPVPAIRFIRSCSSPLSPQVSADLEAAFGAPVLEAYAMTEAAHQLTSNPLPPETRIPGSVGRGSASVEVRILDAAGVEVTCGREGEIAVRGDNVTAGYLNNAAANAESFTRERFFRTGDQGRMDEEGYVYITGRIKELVNKGGEKISPVEIDNVLARHAGVAEAMSFAIPDEKYGQDVGVAVVRSVEGEEEEVTEAALRTWLVSRIAPFKVPRKIFFTRHMPKTPTGKVQRRMVAQEMLKQQEPKSKL